MLDRQVAAEALGWIMLTGFHPTVTGPRKRARLAWHGIRARAGPQQVQQLLGSFPDQVLSAGTLLWAAAYIAMSSMHMRAGHVGPSTGAVRTAYI